MGHIGRILQPSEGASVENPFLAGDHWQDVDICLKDLQKGLLAQSPALGWIRSVPESEDQDLVEGIERGHSRHLAAIDTVDESKGVRVSPWLEKLGQSVGNEDRRLEVDHGGFGSQSGLAGRWGSLLFRRH